MSTHPNAMLILVLTPDDLARKTYRAILQDHSVEDESSPQIKIGGEDYTINVMEEEYDENRQIRARKGDIILHYFITYGYGEKMSWEKLSAKRDALAAWAQAIGEKHKCRFDIFVGANYW